MIEKQQLVLSRLKILSQNVQGLSPDKENILLELMDQLQLDVVFIQETFREPPRDSSEEEIQFLSRAGYAVIEYTNANKRRGIQFRIASHLEPFVLEPFCLKSETIEVLTIQIHETLLIGSYIPDGRNPDGIQRWTEVIDSLEAKFPHSRIVALGDLNCRAQALGNQRQNESSPLLDAWIESSDSFEIHQFDSPTRPACDGYLDIVFYKDLEQRPQVSFEESIPSDHRGIIALIDTGSQPTQVSNPPRLRLKMTRINKSLMELLKRKGRFTLPEVVQIIKQESNRCRKSRRPKPSRSNYRQRCYWFKPSKALETLKQKMFRAKKSGDPDTFNSLRTEFQKLLKYEKKQSFNEYLKETAETKDVKQFYDLMKRLSPKFKWNVNTGSQREESIASQLVELQTDPSYAGLDSAISSERSQVSSVTRTPDSDYFSIVEWNIVMQSLKNRKSPGPDSMTYENWRALDPKLIPFIVQAFSETFTSGKFDAEWFQFYVKPLPKKPGKPEVRPISLLNSIVKIMDRLLLLKLLDWIRENNLITDLQFGFMAGKSSVDQLCRLMNDLESKKGTAMFLLSVDLKGAYDRVDNILLYNKLKDSGLPEEWRPYIFHLLFSRSFKVISNTGISSHWTPLRIGVPQGLPSAPILFNLYINATLKELNAKSSGSYPYADDNTLGIQSRARESRPELVHRTASFVNMVESRYRQIKGVLAKSKSVLIPFFQKFEQDRIAGVPVQKCHKILGVWIDSRRRFSDNAAQVLMKCRKAMIWIQTFRHTFSFQQRKQAYISFVQSLLDYHLLPTWPRMTKKAQLEWTRVTYAAARMILGASMTVSGSIACREAGILPPSQRFRLLLFKRALRCRRLDSTLQKKIYEPLVVKFNLTKYSDLYEKLPLSQTVSRLLYDLNQELLEEYRSRFPARAYLLEGHPPKYLSRASCVAFQFRTESLKTKDWRWRHNQPLDHETFDHTCRLCQSSKETVSHLVHDCPSDQARQARRTLKSYYIRAKLDVPIGPYEILRRSGETRLTRIQDNSLEAFLDNLDMDGLLHCRLSA